MNHLQIILGKHAAAVVESVSGQLTPAPNHLSAQSSFCRPTCSLCRGIDHWQPYGSDQWYCITCDPPPSQSMVAHRTGAPTITSVVAYTVGRNTTHSMSFGGNRIEFPSYETRAVCRCGSHMVTETTWSDGLATFECSSCAASIAADVVR